MVIPYSIGCPVWACEAWQGNLYRNKSPRRKWLTEYSQAFNAVEGNSTFYGLPTLETAQRWCDETPDGFSFALKFPRTITHEKKLRDASADTQAFLKLLEVLADANRLGPTMLQLPPYFAGGELTTLAAYLRSLPSSFPYAVEVRHLDFFGGTEPDLRLHELLTNLGVDRVIFDSRPLFSAPADDEVEAASQSRKPQLPVRPLITGTNPVLRLIGRNDVRKVKPWIDDWAQSVATWIRGGAHPYVFTHAPDDRFAPFLAQSFHNALTHELAELPPLPTWPGRAEARQLSLF